MNTRDQQYVQPNIWNDQQAQPPVIMTQPTMTTTITTFEQGGGLREWSTGIFGCFDDIKSCCCSAFFPSCFYDSLAIRMGENHCVGAGGGRLGCVPGGHTAMRTKLRTQHNIRGDICSDFFAVQFCTPCAMCQMSREMDRLGYPTRCC